MDIVVNKAEFFTKLDEAPLHPRYEIYPYLNESEGEFAFDVDTDDDHDVAMRLVFQCDIDTDGMMHIYTNGLDDGIRLELLGYFTEIGLSYELE